jgi:hypothetical protein
VEHLREGLGGVEAERAAGVVEAAAAYVTEVEAAPGQHVGALGVFEHEVGDEHVAREGHGRDLIP